MVYTNQSNNQISTTGVRAIKYFPALLRERYEQCPNDMIKFKTMAIYTVSLDKVLIRMLLEKGNEAYIKILITEFKYRLNINTHHRDYDGRTFLIIATRTGNLEYVKILMGIDGIDVNACDYKGFTAMSTALSLGYYDIVKFIYSKGGCEKDNILNLLSNKKTALIRMRAQ